MIGIEKEKKNWKKNKLETDYRSFSPLVQTACHLWRVHCRSELEANSVSSGVLNKLSFVHVTGRRVVRMYRTTCRSDKEETTCRFLLPDDLSFECGWTVFFGDKNDVILEGIFKHSSLLLPRQSPPFFFLQTDQPSLSPSLSHVRPPLRFLSLPRRPVTPLEVISLSLSLSPRFCHIFACIFSFNGRMKNVNFEVDFV